MNYGLFSFFKRVMPDTRLWLIALIGEIAMFSERIIEVIYGKHMPLLFDRPSEVHETYLMYFVFCYMYSFYRYRTN